MTQGKDISTVLPDQCDLLVVGSGAGGLAAAVTAAHHGLSVLVLEKAHQFGGTTAWSGGWMWVPRNPLAEAAGIEEPIERPLTYLQHELGERFNESTARNYLEQAPRMVSFFLEKTSVRFIDGNAIPDFHGDTPSAVKGGRSLCAAPFDGRLLGERLHQLRPPLDMTAPWGMGIASGAELRHFLNAMRKWPSFLYVVKRVTKHWLGRLRYGRGVHLVNGNALVAHLAKAALDLGVRIEVSTPVRSLLRENGRVMGVTVETEQGLKTIRAERGVVLATGGFPHDVARKAQLFPHAPSGHEHWSAAPESNTGDGLRMGETVGGQVDTGLPAAAGWAPVSLWTRKDGSVCAYPHLIERGKPGLIAVTRAGKRFVNEANSYYDFMSALYPAIPAGQPVEAWLICDHVFIRRYGLGVVKPAPFSLHSYLQSGYLKQGDDLQSLAQVCGIDAQGLQETVARYNQHAEMGRDPEFHRGETPYNRMQGDAEQQPNPCVAPIRRGPFYAVKVQPGSLGTFAGLRCDEQARVLDANSEPIPGLYACGNDMSSVMEGRYPSGGITLGPAMTYGYVAGCAAAGKEP